MREQKGKGELMPDRIFTALGDALHDNKKASILVFLLIILTPIALNVFFLMERSGYVSNIYQVEHAQIRSDQVVLKELAIGTKLAVEDLKKETQKSNDLSADMAYYLLLICQTQQQDEKGRQECLKPPWMRRLP